MSEHRGFICACVRVCVHTCVYNIYVICNYTYSQTLTIKATLSVTHSQLPLKTNTPTVHHPERHLLNGDLQHTLSARDTHTHTHSEPAADYSCAFVGIQQTYF